MPHETVPQLSCLVVPPADTVAQVTRSLLDAPIFSAEELQSSHLRSAKQEMQRKVREQFTAGSGEHPPL